MPATSQQADNLTQFPDIKMLNDVNVNRNRIRTYGDGNCLYYSVAIIGFTQGIENITNHFDGECENFLEIHNNVLKIRNELLKLEQDRNTSESIYIAKQRELEPRQKELLRCINIFKRSVINEAAEKKLRLYDENDRQGLTRISVAIEESITNFATNWADLDVIGLLEYVLDIEIFCISRQSQNQYIDLREQQRSFTILPQQQRRKIIIYHSGGLHGHFEATNFVN